MQQSPGVGFPVAQIKVEIMLPVTKRLERLCRLAQSADGAPQTAALAARMPIAIVLESFIVISMNNFRPRVSRRARGGAKL